MSITTWLAFLAASWAISLSPGPGAVATMSAGLNHGFRRSLACIAGLILGIWTQILVVGVGLGAVVASSTAAFAAVKWLGAAYLVWLGIQQWRAPAVPLAVLAEGALPPTRRQLLVHGWAVNAVNPKGTVFLLAVVPQFLSPAQPLAPQYAVIALTLGLTDGVVMSGYSLLAARVLRTLKSRAHIHLINRMFGALFVLAGGALAAFQYAH